MAERSRPKVDPRDFEALVQAESRMATFRVQLREMAKRSGIGYRTIARRMNMSLSVVERIVAGKSVTLDTLMRFVWACEHELVLGVRGRRPA